MANKALTDIKINLIDLRYIQKNIIKHQCRRKLNNVSNY